MKTVIAALAGTGLALFVAAAAWAQSVFVVSLSSSQAQIVVNGTAARALWIGETSPEGVTLSYIRSGLASFEAGGRRFTLGLGQSSVAETVLRASSSGHFFANAALNGVTFPAVKIGRASCRERVYISGVGGSLSAGKVGGRRGRRVIDSR